jgi:hypothetical protein
MFDDYKRFYKTINDIDFKMLRKDNWCWIKVEPIKQISSLSSLHFILNGEEHHWDLYDKENKATHMIYFKGSNCNPCFYLKTKDKSFRINFDYKEIKVYPITDSHTLDDYLKDNCSCNCVDASCWVKSLYYTSRPDKPPFDLM